MAQLTRWALFVRAFLVTLLVGMPATRGGAQPTDDADWSATRSIGTADAYFWYLRRNPAGQHVPDAIAALEKLGVIRGGGAARAIATPPAAAAPAAQRAPATGTGGRGTDSDQY